MTPRAVRRRPRAGLLAALLALAATACVDERERLSAPRIVLELTETEVQPGGFVRGRVIAIDRVSGIVAVSVRAQAADSTYRERQEYFPTDSIELEFALRVPATAPEDALVIVLASTINDQLIGNSASDTARVRVAP